MNAILILLGETKLSATIEILFLLIVAAAIGYITAWLYYKSIYTDRIKTIEYEKNKLSKDLLTVESENGKLQKTLLAKDVEINSLKLADKEAARKLELVRSNKNKTIQLVQDRDESLAILAQRKKLLDYQSFGTATEEEKDDLKMISGIGPFIEERLNALDIFTFRQISKFSDRDIDRINNAIDYFSGRIERDEWVSQAADLVHNKDIRTDLFKRISERKSDIQYNRIGTARQEEADDLTVISGIGGWIMEKLNAIEIYTFRQISNFTKEDIDAVTEAIGFFQGRIERDEWILQAKELVRIAGNKSELLKRIRDRQGRIFYDRLGFAHKHEANNLTLINGLGLWVEERLNTLGIYTFDQISKLTREDIDTITEVLEIIPGYIESDNWVGQAKELSKKHSKVE
jgi:predicted flap endonuclease-1-like 5' DNA nuclease